MCMHAGRDGGGRLEILEKGAKRNQFQLKDEPLSRHVPVELLRSVALSADLFKIHKSLAFCFHSLSA